MSAQGKGRQTQKTNTRATQQPQERARSQKNRRLSPQSDQGKAGQRRKHRRGDQRVRRASQQSAQQAEMWSQGVSALAERLGYPHERPIDQTHLIEACTHRTFAHEFKQSKQGRRGEGSLADNQRLEFLGDAVLGMSVAHELMRRDPEASEGELSATRALLINAERLAEIAIETQLEPHLRTGKGEVNMGETARRARLADLTESVIGAIYLDLGWSSAHEWIWRALEPHYRAVSQRDSSIDPKTALQHWTHRTLRETPVYRHSEVSPGGRDQSSGRDHAYQAWVYLREREIGHGWGPNKKSAHFAAARDALERLQRSPSVTSFTLT